MQGVALVAIMFVSSAAADGRALHYGATTDAALLVCDRQAWQGQRKAATSCYQNLLSNNDDAAVRAEAAWALGDLQRANRLFREAVRAVPDAAGIRVRWGDLFAASHHDQEAMNIYAEALELDERNAFAMLGAARVLTGAFDDAADTYLEPLLSDSGKDGGARAGAWLLVARQALENGDRALAMDALNSAEGLLEQLGWPLLELYALRAAADLQAGNENSSWVEKALQVNPAYGDIFAIPAHFYVITRRYRDAIDLYQRAVDIDPTNAAAHEELGVNLLRDNQMSRARRHLEVAHEVDAFSPKAVNTLRLLDSYENFRLIESPDKPEAGVLPIVLRLHRDEARAIAPYAIELTRESIAEFTERYGFELKEPVIIEMYPDHEDFAVRTAGMPGLGILGATFGYVVAMDSPSGRPPDHFQWGTTLWHEMAHVFTLEATDHLVPRWFSEGVSVYEEWRSGPNPGVRIPTSVLEAMHDGRFLPIDELDEGFIRPTYEQQVIVSYMQAGLVCQFIDETYGIEKLRAVLYRFRDGHDTVAAIENVLNMSPAAFDRAFTDFVDRQHGSTLAILDDWLTNQQLIAAKASAGEWSEVVPLATAQIERMPDYAEPDSAYLVLATAHRESGDNDAATQALTDYWQKGGYLPGPLAQLAGTMVEHNRISDAIRIYQAIIQVDPLDAELHGNLGELLLGQKQAVDALREFEVSLALEPHDKATAYFRLAQSHHALGSISKSRESLLQALDVAPNFRPAQRLLLELMRATPESSGAAR